MSGIIGVSPDMNSGIINKSTAGTLIKSSTFNIGHGTCSGAVFPNDDTIPQRSEGTEVFSQVYTPSTLYCTLLLRSWVTLAESSNVADDMGYGLFISDDNDCLTAQTNVFGNYSGDHGHDVGYQGIEYEMVSWGQTEKTFSLRVHKCNCFNLPHQFGDEHATSRYSTAATSTFTIQEIST